MQIHTKRKSPSLTLWLLKRRTNIVLAFTILAIWGFLSYDMNHYNDVSVFIQSSQIHSDLHLGSVAQPSQFRQLPSSTSIHPPYYPPYSTRTNAIIYMAQKSHKVYLRDSMALLSKSLDLLFQNYLLMDDHYLNVTVFIFHTGDFDQTDIDAWEARYPEETRGTLQLINLWGTPYWQTPSHLNEADLPHWRNPEFNIGYRHM